MTGSDHGGHGGSFGSGGEGPRKGESEQMNVGAMPEGQKDEFYI